MVTLPAFIGLVLQEKTIKGCWYGSSNTIGSTFAGEQGLQAFVDIDRESAGRLGITPATIDNAPRASSYRRFGLPSGFIGTSMATPMVAATGALARHLNPDSLQVIGGARLEPSLASAEPGSRWQLERVDAVRGRLPKVRASTSGSRAVVAVAAGPGLASLFSDAGAVVVTTVPGGPLAVSTVLDTILDCGADDVIVLPNSRDFRAVCDAAASQAREAGVHATVIPSWTQVQGLAAVAVHEPGHPFDDDVVAMTSAARGTQHGAITVATESGMTMAGPCLVGDVLGVVDAEFSIIGDEQADVARQVLDRLITGRAELVTLVTGAGLDDDVVPRIERWLRARRPDVEVAVYDGGQERYPLLVAVE